MLKIIGLLIIFTNSFLFFSQDEEPTFYKLIVPKHSYTIEFALPVSVANKPFKGIMQGLVRSSASYQFSLKNGLSIGVGGNYTYFMINRFKITPQILGGMHLMNAYGKLAFEKYYSDRVGIDTGLKIGYNQALFHSDSLSSKNKFISGIVEPYVSFCLTGNHKTAYKWTLSYSFLNHGFSPQQIGDFINDDYSFSEFNRMTRFFSFGFSYSHFFKQW